MLLRVMMSAGKAEVAGVESPKEALAAFAEIETALNVTYRHHCQIRRVF